MKKIIKISFWIVMTTLLFISITNLWVVVSTRGQVFNLPDHLPEHRVALVLGTSHKTGAGGKNPFFHERIKTAARLYDLGKIDHFILSGDNQTKYYNEPLAMKLALTKRGIPDHSITLDYAGFRTLDSIVRCKEIFGQDKITIITQPFHSYRALFICNYYGIDGVAMVAGEPSFWNSFNVKAREIVARPLAVLDLYIFKTVPRFLGKKEPIKNL